jgi:iron complex outermembrane receptor protein
MRLYSDMTTLATDPRRLLVLLLVAAGSTAAGAQTPAPPYRETVVVTAATTPVELGAVTRTLTVITRAQIDALPVQSIADVLRLVASIDVRARGVRGVQTDFAVRGANFGQMLMLVDGVRMNDAQSGHHNGDIPVALDEVERIEILHGPGSALFGADAFGGTVNVITRRKVDKSTLLAQGGSFGLAGARGAAGFERGPIQQTLGLATERSGGFMYDRDYASVIARGRTSIGGNSGLSFAFLRKEFGANNFYGGNAPSREWTNQSLITGDHQFGATAGWTFTARGSYRTHGDHFIFNQTNPALSDNRHRTHAVLGELAASRRVQRGMVTVGIESGGDWIRSTNLGDHELGRISAFGEWRRALGERVQVDGALRLDRYSQFGASWNPSAGIGWWISDDVHLRVSAGRAFRVPTFTERYYSDPANLARADVGPETAWAGEGGADVLLGDGWMLKATVFGRADSDVIDWLRPTVADRWQTYNVRDVDTLGVEVGVQKTFAGGAFMTAQFTGVDLDAAAVTQLSKYVLDYAPRSFTVAGLLPLPGALHVAPRIEYRRRSRPAGTSDYVLVDARVSRRIGRMGDVFIEGSNLFDREYQEIAGVAMPGATVAIGLALRAH